ncbi:hypothetical protein Mapa_004478 [Marchantia paleacea]|nr:hypothetical protein Mapa_004478 [Marchantia paleacea]
MSHIPTSLHCFQEVSCSRPLMVLRRHSELSRPNSIHHAARRRSHWRATCHSFYCITMGSLPNIVAPEAFQNPQQEKVFARVLEISLPSYATCEELTPWASYEKGQLQGQTRKFNDRPLQSNDAGLTQ